MNSMREILLELSDKAEALMTREKDLDNEYENLMMEQRVSYNHVKCKECGVTSTEHPGLTIPEADMAISIHRAKKVYKELGKVQNEIEDAVQAANDVVEELLDGLIFSASVDVW